MSDQKNREPEDKPHKDGKSANPQQQQQQQGSGSSKDKPAPSGAPIPKK